MSIFDETVTQNTESTCHIHNTIEHSKTRI
jgi:hypothetical protein